VNEIAFLASLGLAAVFLTTGLSKLFAFSGFRQTINAFGVSDRFVPAVAGSLVSIEFLLALGLLFRYSLWHAAWGAIALLALFLVAVCANLFLGRKPDCACFGTVHSSPIGIQTVYRLCFLLMIAGLVAALARANPFDVAHWPFVKSMPEFSTVAPLAGTAALMTLMIWLLLQILAQQGRILLEIDSLKAAVGNGPAFSPRTSSRNEQRAVSPIGEQVLELFVATLEGSRVQLKSLVSVHHPLLIAFTDPQCAPCTALLPRLSGWQKELKGAARIVICSTGDAERNRSKSLEYDLHDFYLQSNREVAMAFGATATPAMVRVEINGTIQEQVALGPQAIQQLVSSIALEAGVELSGPEKPSPKNQTKLSLGDPLPDVILKRPDGTDVSLSSFVGRRLVLLFWNPKCGYCQAMLPQLAAFENGLNDAKAELLIVSTGTSPNQGFHPLRFPFVVDSSFAVARTFGAEGTPAAIVIGPDGCIASLPAAGAKAILSLIASPTISKKRAHARETST
jgi:peroxiredoxin